MKQRKKRFRVCRGEKENGFSLVELLLTATLLTIMVVIITGTMSLSKLMFQKSSIDSQCQGALKRTLQIVTRDLSEGYHGLDTRPDCTGCVDSSCAILNNPLYICIVQGTSIGFKVVERTDVSLIHLKTIRYDFDAAAKTLSRTEISEAEVMSGVITATAQVIGRNLTSVSFQSDPNNPTVVRIALTSGTLTHRSEVTLRSSPLTG